MFSLLDLIFVLSMHYVRKGSRAFYLNYPEINEVGKSNHMVITGIKNALLEIYLLVFSLYTQNLLVLRIISLY